MRIVKAEVFLDEEKKPQLKTYPAKLYKPLGNLFSPEDVVEVMSEVFFMDRQITELVYLIALDSRKKPLCFFLLNKGTINYSIVDIRGIMVNLLLCNAESFILVHNHVSGDVTPSKEDGIVTERVRQAAEIINLEFLDHIIIGENRTYYSYKAQVWQGDKT